MRGVFTNDRRTSNLRLEMRLACWLAVVFLLSGSVVCGQATPPAGDREPTVVTTTLPSVEQIKQRIATVEANDSIAETEKSALVSSLNEVLLSLGQIAENGTLLPSLVAAADQAGAKQDRLKRELDRPLSEQDLPGQSLSNHSATDLETASLETLKTGKREAETQLAELTSSLQTLQSTIRSRREESQSLPQRIAGLQASLETMRAPVEMADGASTELTEAANLTRETKLAAIKAQLDVAQQKQRTYEAEAELLPLQQSDLERRISATKASLELISARLSNERKVQISEQIVDFKQAVGGLSLPLPLASETDEMIEQWPTLIDNIRLYGRQLVELNSSSSNLKSDFEKTSSLVENDLKTGGGLSRGVGFLLERKRGKLPEQSDLSGDRERLSKTVDQAQELLARTDAILDELPSPSTGSAPLTDLENAVKTQRDLLKQIETDAERLLMETLIPMGVELDKYGQTVQGYRNLINEHLLWVRSDQPLGTADVVNGLAATRWFFQRDHWLALRTAFRQLVSDDPLALMTALLLVGLLFAIRPWFSRFITRMGEQAQKRTSMEMRSTFIAMGATMMLSLPIALCFGVPGRLLANSLQDNSFVIAFSDALFVMAALILPLEFLRQFLRPCGVAMAHFGWPPAAIIPTRQTIRWIMGLLLPLIFVWRIYELNYELDAGVASLSRLLFTLLMIISAVLIWRLSHPRRGAMVVMVMATPNGWIEKLRWIWHPLLTAVPLGLGLLMILGYGYSSMQLAERVYYTVWIFISVVVLYGLAIRWLTISRRQLAIQQLRERSASKGSSTGSSAGTEGGPLDIIDDKQADLSTINQQTRRLIDAAIFVGILSGLYVTWSSVFPALGFLDRVELWTQKANDGTVIDVVTLSNLVLAIPMLVLTFVIVRNVPGLLETTLLQRLPLENAVRYAITTLTSYLLAGLGIVLAAGTLGLHWSSIQWLVAGLGVGLGFGLQEIFANFISGIILLFEQPIRVGDVVTLDGTTGVVSRIRMRATTITNWDRQEYVVPNKDFITGRLVNWTLSDTTNRVVVNVGIAYGSDTRQACRILEEVCRDHPHVLDNPEPLITFEGFGDSTLNIVIRFYLSTLDGRLRVIHEIHTAIDDRFREAEIEIAFPQRDLHIRTMPKLPS